MTLRLRTCTDNCRNYLTKIQHVSTRYSHSDPVNLLKIV